MTVEAASQLGTALPTNPLMVPLVTVLLSLCMAYIYHQNKRETKLAYKIPGPTPLPLIGNAHHFINRKNDEIMSKALELSQSFGSVVRGWLGSRLFVFLCDPRDVEIILNSSVHIDKSEDYKFFQPWLGEGLLISTGQLWKSHRKLIAPAFHMNVLKSFMKTFNDNSRNTVRRMQKETGKEFDVHDYMSEATVDILLETAMGHKRTSENKEGYEYAMAVMKMCDILHNRQMKLFYRYKPIFFLSGMMKQQEKLLGIIHGLTKKVIKDKKSVFNKNLKEGKLPSPSLQEIIKEDKEVDRAIQRAKSKGKTTEGLRDDLDDIDENDIGEKRRLAFLDLMIETAHHTKQLTDDQIKDQVDTIMFEGHDTTAAGSSFTLCMLGIHQDVQDKVMDELNSIFGDSDREATFNDTLEMKYLERVILESLRMFPPVPMIARKLNQDVRLASEDYLIPSNTTIVIATYKIHRDPKTYPNPEKFDPDNFLPEKTANRHYYSYIPFSAGPRSCVGRKYAMLKLKVLLSTILRNYHVKSNVTEKDFKLQADIILKRTDGFRIVLEPRQKN